MKSRGFTLVELMVVIAIIAFLFAVALPNYRQYVVASKRTEAHAKLLEVAGMYEKFYANTNRYPSGLSGGGNALDLNSDYLQWVDYQIVVEAQANNGWRLQANAIGNQLTDDPGCSGISLDNLGTRTPIECWE